jgi:hypothetical protein
VHLVFPTSMEEGVLLLRYRTAKRLRRDVSRRVPSSNMVQLIMAQYYCFLTSTRNASGAWPSVALCALSEISVGNVVEVVAYTKQIL